VSLAATTTGAETFNGLEEARSERTDDATAMVAVSRSGSSAIRTSSVSVKPGVELIAVEPHEVADLDVRDSSLGDEPADVTDARVEVDGDAFDIEQRLTGAHSRAWLRHGSPSRT